MEIVAAAFLAFVVGYFIGTPVTEEYQSYHDKNWSVYITYTDDPAVYKGVYSKNGMIIHEVTGRGIGDTLKKLAESIDEKYK